MYISDRRRLGEMVFQDHRTGVDIPVRSSLTGCRVVERDPFGRYRAQGHAGNTSPERSVGDVVCTMLTQPKSYKNREMPVFTLGGMPSQLTKKSLPPAATVAGVGRLAELVPIRKKNWSTDGRFGPKAGVKLLEVPLPVGQPGLMITGTEEFSQEEVFLPANVPLIAPNCEGDAALGTPVFDLNKDDEPDRDRQAPLQTAWRVIKKGALCTKDKAHDAIAWQIGNTGLKAKPAYGLTAEKDGGIKGPIKPPPPPAPPPGGNTNFFDPKLFILKPATPPKRAPAPPYVVGFAGKFRGGPLDNSRYRIEHKLGEDDKGAPIVPTGIAIEAFFRDDNNHDAPLDFEQVPFANVGTYQFFSQVHLRHDERIKHKSPCGDVPGVWRFQAEVPYTIADGLPYPPIGEGLEGFGDGILIPQEDDRRVYPKHETGDGFVVADPLVNPTEAARENKFFQMKVGDSAGLRRRFFGDRTQALPSFPATIRAGGGMVFRAFATNDNEADLATGSMLSIRQAQYFRRAPDVAALLPVGRGTGRWKEFDGLVDNKETGASRAHGGIVLLPPKYATPKGLQEVIAGDYDPGVSDKAVETQASLFIPAKLASIDFARPTGGYISGQGLAGNRTANGIRLHQTINGLEMQGLNASGGEVTDQAWILGEGGDITHKAANGVVHTVLTDGGGSSKFNLQTSRGTIASPTKVNDNDVPGCVSFSAYDTFMLEVGRVESIVESSTSGVFESSLNWYTMDSGTLRKNMWLAAVGFLNLYSSTIAFRQTGGSTGTLLTTTSGVGQVTQTLQHRSGTIANLDQIGAGAGKYDAYKFALLVG